MNDNKDTCPRCGAAIWRGKCVDPRCQIASLEEEVDRLQNSEQSFIDAAAYYRNLAIVLGAKPEQMRSRYDRDLCEKGLESDTLEEVHSVWEELKRVEKERDKFKAQLAKWAERWEAGRKCYFCVLPNDDFLACKEKNTCGSPHCGKYCRPARIVADPPGNPGELDHIADHTCYDCKWGRYDHLKDEVQCVRDPLSCELAQERVTGCWEPRDHIADAGKKVGG